MKKTVLAILAVLSMGLLTGCGMGTVGTAQSTANTSAAGNGSVLGGASVSDILSGVISTFGGGISTNKATIVGTWNYYGPCVQFESESLLSKAGGTVMSNKIEQKLGEYYQKAGIKQGACTFVFGSDNSFKYTIAGKTYQGTYTYNSADKTVNIKNALGHQVTAYISVAGNQMGLTADATKLLTLMSQASAVSSKLSGISAVAGSFSGMKLGFKFSK